MSIVSLVIAPTLAQLHGTNAAHGHTNIQKDVQVTVVKNDSVQVDVYAQQPQESTNKLVDALKNDQIIKGDTYTIEFENGKLKIDGVEINSEKYKELIPGEKIKIVVIEEKK